MSEITEEMVEAAAKAMLLNRHPMTRPEDIWLDPRAVSDARAALTAALQAAEAQPVDGWMLVPAEPTEAMLDRACADWVKLYPAFDGEKPQPTAGEVADTIYRAMLSTRPLASTPSHSLAEAENADIIPNLDLLSPEEKRALLTKAKNLWKALQENNLGGYSGINRPFYILEAFRSAIEDFGKRNTGYRHSKNEINAHESALSIAEAKP